MIKLNSCVTDSFDFYQGIDPFSLIEKYGSPLFVYNERVLRNNCRELKSLTNYPKFSVNYSAKANSNLALLQIINDEGLNVDAMSPGEIFIEMKAGFKPSQIFFISNNVSEEEMKYAIENDVLTSVDSLSQLAQFGRINNGGKVAIRFNPGFGVGHNEKVVTAGENTKFGVNPEYIENVKEILKEYNLKLVGINQHIGSLFMNGSDYLKSIENLLSIAKNFKELEFIDMGGGFGVPYEKQKGQARLDLNLLGKGITKFIETFTKEYGKELTFKIEPGRYIPCESGVLLGVAHSVKNNANKKFIGTDIGFNVLLRTVLYDAKHEIEIYRKTDMESKITEKVTIVGNICESGDILAKDIELPQIHEKDIICVLDAGSYVHSMCSNYNNRLRPAEVLIRENSEVVLIRRRDTLEDIASPYISLETI